MPPIVARVILFMIVLPLLMPGRGVCEDLFVWKASLKIAAKMTIVQENAPTDLVVTRKLKNADIINLALGRPLETKINKDTEILAAVGTFEDPSSSPLARLIVFDPTQNGLAQVTTTVVRPTVLDFGKAYLGSTSGVVGSGSATILATTVGNALQNGFLPTTIHGGGEGSGTHLAPPDFSPLGVKVKAKGSYTGRIIFNFTQNGVTQVFDGFIIKGEGKVSGKAIGMFVE